MAQGKSCFMMAEPGAGKTLAYVLPLLDKLMRERAKFVEPKDALSFSPRILIVTTQGEFMYQLLDTIAKLSELTDEEKALVAAAPPSDYAMPLHEGDVPQEDRDDDSIMETEELNREMDENNEKTHEATKDVEQDDVKKDEKKDLVADAKIDLKADEIADATTHETIDLKTIEADVKPDEKTVTADLKADVTTESTTPVAADLKTDEMTDVKPPVMSDGEKESTPLATTTGGFDSLLEDEVERGIFPSQLAAWNLPWTKFTVTTFPPPVAVPTNRLKHPDILIACPGLLDSTFKKQYSQFFKRATAIVIDEADAVCIQKRYAHKIADVAKKNKIQLIFSTALKLRTMILSHRSPFFTFNNVIGHLPRYSTVDAATGSPLMRHRFIEFVDQGEEPRPTKQQFAEMSKVDRKALKMAIKKHSNARMSPHIKVTKLLKVMDETLERIAATGTGEKWIIFAESRESVELIAARVLVHCKTNPEATGLVSLIVMHGASASVPAFRRFVPSAPEPKKLNLLIMTDVAARGIDFKEVSTVVNFDCPVDYSTYVSRAGRTARGEGNSGETITFAEPRNMKLLHEIRRFIPSERCASETVDFENTFERDVGETKMVVVRRLEAKQEKQLKHDERKKARKEERRKNLEVVKRAMKKVDLDHFNKELEIKRAKKAARKEEAQRLSAKSLIISENPIDNMILGHVKTPTPKGEIVKGRIMRRPATHEKDENGHWRPLSDDRGAQNSETGRPSSSNSDSGADKQTWKPWSSERPRNQSFDSSRSSWNSGGGGGGNAERPWSNGGQRNVFGDSNNARPSRSSGRDGNASKPWTSDVQRWDEESRTRSGGFRYAENSGTSLNSGGSERQAARPWNSEGESGRPAQNRGGDAQMSRPWSSEGKRMSDDFSSRGEAGRFGDSSRPSWSSGGDEQAARPWSSGGDRKSDGENSRPSWNSGGEGQATRPWSSGGDRKSDDATSRPTWNSGSEKPWSSDAPRKSYDSNSRVGENRSGENSRPSWNSGRDGQSSRPWSSNGKRGRDDSGFEVGERSSWNGGDDGPVRPSSSDRGGGSDDSGSQEEEGRFSQRNRGVGNVPRKFRSNGRDGDRGNAGGVRGG